MSEYSKLSKDELEELGRKYGVELDRRLLKSKMVKQLEKHISSLSKDELEELGREDGIELDKRLKKEKLVEQIATPTIAVQGGTNRAKWLAQVSAAELKRWEEDPNNHNPEQGRA